MWSTWLTFVSNKNFPILFLLFCFRPPLPTPVSFSTIIRATNAGWLGYVVPAFACASNWEWRRQLSVFPCISPVWILFSPEHWDPWGEGGRLKKRHGTCDLFHLSWGGGLLLVSSWTRGQQRVELRTRLLDEGIMVLSSPVSACQFKTKEVSDVVRANFLIVAKQCF